MENTVVENWKVICQVENINKSKSRPSGYPAYLCECTLCGLQKVIKRDNLKRKANLKCKCQSFQEDLTGQKFNSLTVIGLAKERRGNCVTWECRCDCGKITTVTTSNLKFGAVKSCGCTKGGGKQDLIGQRFGKLVVTKGTNKSKNGSPVWLADCDCGTKDFEISSRALIHSGTKSCGCIKSPDLVGQRFGKLVVVKLIGSDKRGQRKWLCECDCGGNTITTTAHLTAGDTKSCGCYAGELHSKDISNQRFGKLVAVKPTEKRKVGSVVWECICDCGNIKEASVEELSSGLKSCGCFFDLTGQKFGLLYVESKSDKRTKDGMVIYNCICDCGNRTEVISSNLPNGHTRSCGCLSPSYDTSIELKVEEILKELGVNYSKQTTFISLGFSESLDCPQLLYHPCDFVLPDFKLVIECDGDYWHCYPHGRVKDFYQNKIIKFNGWNILRLWEKEIHNEDCYKIIKEKLTR